MSEAERIARDASAHIVEAFDRADPQDVRCPFCAAIYYYNPSLMDASPAHEDPDCLPEDDGGTIWRWTKLGTEVRNVLLSSLKGEGNG